MDHGMQLYGSHVAKATYRAYGPRETSVLSQWSRGMLGEAFRMRKWLTPERSIQSMPDM